MHNFKYPPELKLKIARAYFYENETINSLANQYNIGKTSIKEWIWRYREHGETAFQICSSSNASYSSEFKNECVQAVLTGKFSVNEVVAKYSISSRSLLRSWIKEYNANGTLRDYDPQREVYMADAQRKTTLEERKTIVKYCLDHGKDYKNTAAFFDVSYNQVFVWVKKYESCGEEGLTDKRGKHKSDDEVDELERLRRENARLKRQLEEKGMTIELLKKVKEFERM